MGPEPRREQTGEFPFYAPEPLTWPPGAPLMTPLEQRAVVTRDQIFLAGRYGVRVIDRGWNQLARREFSSTLGSARWAAAWDGEALWYGSNTAGGVHRLSPSLETLQEYPFDPNPFGNRLTISGMVVLADGRIAWTEARGADRWAWPVAFVVADPATGETVRTEFDGSSPAHELHPIPGQKAFLLNVIRRPAGEPVESTELMAVDSDGIVSSIASGPGWSLGAVGDPATHVVHSDGRLLAIDPEACRAGDCFGEVRRLAERGVVGFGRRDAESFYVVPRPDDPTRGRVVVDECSIAGGCRVELHRFDSTEVQSRHLPFSGLAERILDDPWSEKFYVLHGSRALFEYDDF